MADAHEMVDPAKLGLLLAILSGACLLAALALVPMARKRGGAVLRAALLCGAGVFVFPMWLVYNGIEDRLGLDSVAALLINLALFAALGTTAGLLIGRFWPHDDSSQFGKGR